MINDIRRTGVLSPMALAGTTIQITPKDSIKLDEQKRLGRLQKLLSEFQPKYDRMFDAKKKKLWTRQIKADPKNTKPIQDIAQSDKDSCRDDFVRAHSKNLKTLRTEMGDTLFKGAIVGYYLPKRAKLKYPSRDSKQAHAKLHDEKAAFGRWVLAGILQHQKEQAAGEAQRMAESAGKTKPKSKPEPDPQVLAQESERKLILAAKNYAANLPTVAADRIFTIERLANFILRHSTGKDWQNYAINLGLMLPHEENKHRQDLVAHATHQYHLLYGLLADDLANRQPLRAEQVREIFALVKPGILANREKIPYGFYLAMRLYYPDQTPDFENMPAPQLPKKPPRVKAPKLPRALRKEPMPEAMPATALKVTAKREREPGKRPRPGSAKHRKKKYGSNKVDLSDPNNATGDEVLVHTSATVAVVKQPDRTPKPPRLDLSQPTGTPTHNLESIPVGSSWASVTSYVQEISVILRGLSEELQKSTVEADRKFGTFKIKSLLGAITTVERTAKIKPDVATENLIGLGHSQLSDTYASRVSAFFVTCQKAAAAISSFQQDNANHTGLQDVIGVLFGPKDANASYVDKVRDLATRLQNTK